MLFIIGSGCLKVENRVVGKAFGPKREEVTWDWKKLHNGDVQNSLFNKYYS
jgi:hypothetical protein